MRTKPLVSVITPFYNAEKFIQEAIDSVFSQTYDNWELLLVDDGSSDRTTEIALRYAERYSGKVRYLQHAGHQNRGACTSRNMGIRNARGEYIALLDADDVWLPHKLERQVAILNSHPEAGMVSGASQHCYSWAGNSEDSPRDYVPEYGVLSNTLVKHPKLLTLFYPLGNGCSPCVSDLLLQREVIERIAGFEESWTGILQLYEDQAFLAKVYLTTPVFVSSECWIIYRQHPDSCVSVVTEAGQYHTVRRFFLNWLEEYLSKHKVKDAEVWKVLRNALWPYRHPNLHRLSRHARQFMRRLKSFLKRIAGQALPAPVRRWIRIQQGRFRRIGSGAFEREMR